MAVFWGNFFVDDFSGQVDESMSPFMGFLLVFLMFIGEILYFILSSINFDEEI